MHLRTEVHVKIETAYCHVYPPRHGWLDVLAAVRRVPFGALSYPRSSSSTLLSVVAPRKRGESSIETHENQTSSF